MPWDQIYRSTINVITVLNIDLSLSACWLIFKIGPKALGLIVSALKSIVVTYDPIVTKPYAVQFSA